MGRWQGHRWAPAGTNSGGDPMYERNLEAGDPDVGQPTSESMTKKELQAQAEARGLETTGTKQELLERLAQ